MNKLILSLSLLMLLQVQQTLTLDKVGPLAGFIRTNIVGHPVLHERKLWIFDPEVARKRSRTFIELHGDKGEKLIERLGVGIDGREEERLLAQRLRDEGHLGGLNALLP